MQSARVQGTVETPVPSFAFPGSSINGPGISFNPAYYSGTNTGVPGNNSVGTSDPNASDNVSPAVNYGAAASKRVWYQQPLFWAVVLGVLGVIMLAHVARIEIK